LRPQHVEDDRIVAVVEMARAKVENENH
jgi:hypothetical protein